MSDNIEPASDAVVEDMRRFWEETVATGSVAPVFARGSLMLIARIDALRAENAELSASKAELLQVDERWSEQVADLQGQVERLTRERDGWKTVAEGRRKMMVCYRAGTQRGAETALKLIGKGERMLNELKASNPTKGGKRC